MTERDMILRELRRASATRTVARLTGASVAVAVIGDEGERLGAERARCALRAEEITARAAVATAAGDVPAMQACVRELAEQRAVIDGINQRIAAARAQARACGQVARG